MARPKKSTAKAATAKKTTRKPATKAATARGKGKPATKEQMSSSLKTQTAAIKLLKGTATRRPPNNPDVPQEIIDTLNADFNSILELLDSFSQHLRALDRCRKARGFSAWSLRYAQTPHIIRGVLPKAKLLSYPA